jgi:hypothetical protein
MRVVREDFIRQLEMVEAGLSTREQMEQSSCFAFQGGRVITFNDEVSCQAPSLLEEDFEGALVAAPFLESLKLMPEVHLQLEKENGVLKVLGKAGRGFEVPFLKKVGLPLDMLHGGYGRYPGHQVPHPNPHKGTFNAPSGLPQGGSRVRDGKDQSYRVLGSFQEPGRLDILLSVLRRGGQVS